MAMAYYACINDQIYEVARFPANPGLWSPGNTFSPLGPLVPEMDAEKSGTDQKEGPKEIGG
jgi:hypothetical protein